MSFTGIRRPEESQREKENVSLDKSRLGKRRKTPRGIHPKVENP
jgi:hypothetical protein